MIVHEFNARGMVMAQSKSMYINHTEPNQGKHPEGGGIVILKDK